MEPNRQETYLSKLPVGQGYYLELDAECFAVGLRLPFGRDFITVLLPYYKDPLPLAGDFDPTDLVLIDREIIRNMQPPEYSCKQVFAFDRYGKVIQTLSLPLSFVQDGEKEFEEAQKFFQLTSFELKYKQPSKIISLAYEQYPSIATNIAALYGSLRVSEKYFFEDVLAKFGGGLQNFKDVPVFFKAAKLHGQHCNNDFQKASLAEIEPILKSAGTNNILDQLIIEKLASRVLIHKSNDEHTVLKAFHYLEQDPKNRRLALENLLRLQKFNPSTPETLEAIQLADNFRHHALALQFAINWACHAIAQPSLLQGCVHDQIAGSLLNCPLFVQTPAWDRIIKRILPDADGSGSKQRVALIFRLAPSRTVAEVLISCVSDNLTRKKEFVCSKVWSKAFYTYSITTSSRAHYYRALSADLERPELKSLLANFVCSMHKNEEPDALAKTDLARAAQSLSRWEISDNILDDLVLSEVGSENKTAQLFVLAKTIELLASSLPPPGLLDKACEKLYAYGKECLGVLAILLGNLQEQNHVYESRKILDLIVRITSLERGKDQQR